MNISLVHTAVALLLVGLLGMQVCQSLTGSDAEPPTPPTTEPPSPARPYRVVGYHPSWMNAAWQHYDYAALDELIFFDLAVGADGGFAEANGWPDAWQGMIDHARRQGTTVVPTISLLDADAYLAVFNSPAAQARLRDELLTLLDDAAIGGLHLDFEVFDPLAGQARNTLTAFVRAVRADLDALDRGDLVFSLFTLAHDPADVHDEAALAPYVDFFIVQGYDLHWLTSDVAGPLSALDGWGDRNWRYVIDRYRRLGVPAEKMVMAVPYYGYEWPTESAAPGARTRAPGKVLTYAPVAGMPWSAVDRAGTYGQHRDTDSGSPYYTYQDSTGWHQGWFEDAVSLAAKYAFVKREGLGGVAIFPLSYGDPTLAGVLRTAFPRSNTAPGD